MAVVDRRRGRYIGPPGDERVFTLPQDIKALDAAWDRYLGTLTPPDELDPSTGRGEVDMSPEAVAERARLKARHAEAMAYVASYTGTFGLILDIRASERWGTKYMKLTPRQVDAILASRDRDAARASAPRHPRYDEAIAELQRAGSYPNTSDFAMSLIRQVTSGRTLTDRQVEALLRNAPKEASREESRSASLPQSAAAEAPGLAPQSAAGSTVARRPGPAAEGWYRVGEDVFKVQRAVHGSGQLYAKRLTVADGHGTWEYAKGMVWQLRPEQRLTVEEAAAFGKLYGICAICGKVLTDERSIEAGIGPVCISKL